MHGKQPRNWQGKIKELINFIKRHSHPLKCCGGDGKLLSQLKSCSQIQPQWIVVISHVSTKGIGGHVCAYVCVCVCAGVSLCYCVLFIFSLIPVPLEDLAVWLVSWSCGCISHVNIYFLWQLFIFWQSSSACSVVWENAEGVSASHLTSALRMRDTVSVRSSHHKKLYLFRNAEEWSGGDMGGEGVFVLGQHYLQHIDILWSAKYTTIWFASSLQR